MTYGDLALGIPRAMSEEALENVAERFFDRRQNGEQQAMRFVITNGSLRSSAFSSREAGEKWLKENPQPKTGRPWRIEQLPPEPITGLDDREIDIIIAALRLWQAMDLSDDDIAVIEAELERNPEKAGAVEMLRRIEMRKAEAAANADAIAEASRPLAAC